MKEKEFKAFIEDNKKTIEKKAKAAAELHDKECNQKYGDGKPYSFHLEMVARYAIRWGYLVCGNVGHVIPIIFGAYKWINSQMYAQNFNYVLTDKTCSMPNDVYKHYSKFVWDTIQKYNYFIYSDYFKTHNITYVM